MLKLRDITKRFGDTDVLRGVSAEIQKGEIFTIIGPSGAGKSTLLRIIDFLDTPTSGSVIFGGRDITSEGSIEVRRRMGMVFQKSATFNTTVFENVAIGLRFRGMPETDVRKKITEALEIVGLTGFEERKAKTLSGGEMQRVALARVLVTNPDLLLLDEPTANLDPVSVEMIEDLIKKINQDFGITILMSTHDMVQGQRLAHRIGVMMNGIFSQIGTPREIFSAPHDRYVARFVGIENIIEGTITAKDGGLATIEADGTLLYAISPLTERTHVHLFLRPEDIALSCTGEHATSVRNVLPGKVVEITPMGPLNRLILDCGVELIAVITWKATEELGIRVGSEICASFKASAVHVVER